MLLSQGQAKAILNVNIFDDGPNLKMTVTGSITGSPGNAKTDRGFCGSDGVLSGQSALLCTGPSAPSPTNLYSISGPAGFGGNGDLTPATSVDGFTFMLIPSSFGNGLSFYSSTYQLDDFYTLGQPFLSSATFNDTNLASQGFTVTGLVGTWTINGTSESINVCIGSGPCASDPTSSVPGPLPLFGAGAAFGWSRKLRKRIAAPLSTPPQA